ncbi:hypothetical protein [Thalassobacillus pellis]|uniref:hypothetical protein n=1 Tax=Thalassobacillus pellis TaxID=748008 RepID=UPI00195FB82B|nr:hypothetical protein [Thalassobacillus pellis]MBM7554579.1 hypothetical protein [Thalassobacillus pellis]
MNKRWLSWMILAGLVLASFTPIAAVEAAGNGQWDTKGTYNLYYRSAYGWWDTANVKSTGGGFRIKGALYNVDYELWEYDPGPGNDDLIGHHYQVTWDPYGVFNVNRFVDGSNNRAELYVKTYVDAGSVKFWD